MPIDKYFTISPGISFSFGLSDEADTAIEAGPVLILIFFMVVLLFLCRSRFGPDFASSSYCKIRVYKIIKEIK